MKKSFTYQTLTRWLAPILVCTGLLLSSLGASAQTTYTIPGSYLTIADAITDLNTPGFVGAGGVIFDVAAGHTETLGSATAGIITATGTEANPIVFQKSGAGANPKITSFVIGSATTSDGMIKIAGGDYITFDGIDLQENPTNTINLKYTDWGYALVKKQNTAPFNGCQFVTIKNCTITLNKTNTSAIGIYSGNHIATATTNLTITATTDAMSNCKFFNNSISNVYTGISLNGSSNSSYYDQNNEVGVDGANSITNYGGSTVTSYGIYHFYQNNIKIANNTISGGTGQTGTFYGIMNSTGTNSSMDVYNNTITLTPSNVTSSVYGISFSTGGSGTSNTINIYGNIVANCMLSAATSAAFYGFYMTTSSPVYFNFYNNKVRNNTYGNVITTATGSIYPIYLSGTANSTTGSTWKTYNNEVYGNTRIQSTLGSGTFYGIYQSGYGLNTQMYNNIVRDNIMPNTTSTVYLLYLGGTTTTNKTIYGNQLYNHEGGGFVYPLYNTGGLSANIYNNSIYNIQTDAATGAIYGIYSTTTTTANIYNNYISDLRSPYSSSATAVNGINIVGGTYVNIYYNTVYLNAQSSSMTVFGTNALFVSSIIPIIDIRNNIFVNKSDPGPTEGNATAFRYASATLTNIASTTNNNCYLAGTPANNRLIFWDGGTNLDQTIDAYQLRLDPRESASFTGLPPFINDATPPFNLHLTPGSTTKCEGGGQPIAGITDDFDGNPRDGSTPDVGADEFAGIPVYTCTTPAPGGTQASANGICFGESVTLSLEFATPGTGVFYQWKESIDGTNYTNITGATLPTRAVTPVVPMWYYCEVTCLNDPLGTVSSTTVPITFANSVLSTTPATRCGTGTVTLGATTNVGADVYWFGSPNGGAIIGSGSPLITPVISNTTPFYASAGTTSVYNGAKPAPNTAVSGASLSNYGLRFNTFNPILIEEVDIYPTTTAGVANIALYDNTGTLIYGPIAVNFNAGNGTVPQTIPLGFFVSSGIQYRLMINTMSGGSLNRESGGNTWPYASADFSVTGGCSGAGGGTTSTSYYWFYNWKVRSFCLSPMEEVTATVTPPPAITANATATTLCKGQNTTLSVTSPNDPNYTYTWNPGQLLGDAHTVTPTVTTTYTVTAVDNSGLGNDGCVTMADVVITVNPLPPPVSVLPVVSDVCPGVVVPIEATGGYDFSKQANAYVFRASSGSFMPLSGGTTVPTVQADDVMSSAIPIGFPFKYSGNNYTNLFASSNGFVSFNSGAVNAATNNMTTAANTMLPLIAPLWDDLDGKATGGSTASYLTTGTPGNQVFTFEWLNWEWNWQATTAVISFQVKLYESDGHIEFIYRPESGAYNPGTTGGASIGLAGTTTGNFLSLNGTGVSPTASNITETTNIATKPATGQVYSFYPPSYPVVWSPSAGLFTDPAATIPYAGENLMQVFAKPGSSTIYTAQAITPANCNVSANANVNLFPLPAVTVPNITEYICPGGSKTLSFDLTGTPPWSITVNDGAGVTTTTGIMSTPWTYQVSPNVPTTYTVTSLTDAICTSSPGVSVTVDFHPVPMPVVTGTSPICVEGSTVLDAGAGYVTYLWSDQSTLQTLAVDGTPIGPNGTAVFWVTVTNQFGCEGSVSSTVATFPELTVNAGQDVAGCPGFSAQLDANGIGGGGTYIQYDWSPVVGLSAINVKNPVATPSVATTYTVTVTDNNQCVATDDVVVFFADQVPPTVITKNATVYLDAFGQASITVNDIDDGSYDNCAIVSMVLDNTDFYCNNIGAQNTVTLTVTDVMQNTASATALVTVLDIIPPTVVTKDITVYLDASGMATITPGQVNVPYSYSTFTGTNDNCWQIASLALDKTTFDCTNLGPNTVTLTATDPHQNSGSATAIVTVLDNIPPVIQCATPAQSYTTNTGQCSYTIPNVALNPVSVTDNCAGTTYTNNYNQTATLQNAVFPVGTHQVIWTALDASNNPATCTQTIVVNDLQQPAISCPQPASQYLVNSGCYYAVPGTALDVSMAMVSDNCGILSIINSFTGTSTLQGAQFPRGTTQVTWTVTDVNNNVRTCSYNVFVKGYNLSGKFTYYKLNNSGMPVNPSPPLDNITIQLRDAGNNLVAQTVTDQGGNYSFTDLCLGTLYMDATSTKPHGSINTTDAIQAFKWGVTPYPIEKVRFRAGDVNTPTNYLDMGDAIDIMNYFLNGNTPGWTTIWKFWKAGETVNVNGPTPALDVPYPPVTISGNITANFYGMLSGDFNGSYLPVAGLKSSGSVILQQGETIGVKAGEDFMLPVSAGMDMDITAVSLAMNYPTDKVLVKGVTLAGTSDPVDFSVQNGELRIGYMSPVPLALKIGEPLFTLHLEASGSLKQGEQILFTLTQNPDIELADASNQVIPHAELTIGKVETTTGIGDMPAGDLLTLANHPNPFGTSTNFTYNLPAGGKVSLVISDMIGRTVAEPVIEMQQPGSYTLPVDTRELKPGTYSATLRVETTDGNLLTQTIRIVSNQ